MISTSIPVPEHLTEEERKQAAQLEYTWREPAGFIGWFKAVHHTTIGVRYVITAFCFFLIAGLLAGAMRIQLAFPESHFLSADKYNQFFTMHGSTMMFLFAVPMMFEALSVYLVPLMVGTRNIAFPRLNAYSYYLYLFGGIMFYAAFLCNTGADRGWFSYVPLAGPDFAPGKRADFWAQLITFTEISGLAVAVEVLVTVFKLRAPGMSLNRIPLFVWGQTVVAFMVIFSLPAIMLSSTMLLLDRTGGTQFFNPAVGGDVLLYQHLFWWFGHPEVYLIFLPGTAVVSTIVATFSRRHAFGYLILVLALVSTGFLAFGLWVHHMFATGIPQIAESYFTAASMMIAIPSGAQIFCWIATMATGRVVLKTPMWWVLGFFFVFIMGGMTGIFVASVPVDLQVHDTYFVVAHFHYVLIGGAVFPLFGAMTYWFPKVTGRMLNERLGQVSFWLFFIGFNVTFFPMHLVGLRGMPRRVYTYPANMGWTLLNQIESLGYIFLFVSVLIFMWNVYRSLRSGIASGPNPWLAGTLEWATSSPPPKYNFLHLPTVNGREALWDAAPNQPVVIGLDGDARSVLTTRTLDAEPEGKDEFPGPSIWPFLAALATTAAFVASVFTPWGITFGSIPIAITMIGWFWPDKHAAARRRGKGDMAERVERAVLDVSKLPTVLFGTKSLTWCGIIGMMAIEGMVFVLMIASYFYLHSRSVEWPPHENPPALFWGTLNLVVFLVSVIPNEWYRRRARRADKRAMQIGLVVLSLFGIANLVIRYFELRHLNCDWSLDAYGSAVWMLMGLHVTHLLTDLVDTIVLTVLFFTPLVEGKRYMDASENADYWYFVVVTWVPIYLVIYWVPRWLHA